MSTAALDAYFEELLAPVATPSADVEIPPPANDATTPTRRLPVSPPSQCAKPTLGMAEPVRRHAR